MHGTEEALAHRSMRYAMKFVNDSQREPGDTELAKILANCTRPAKPEEYPAIRAHVHTYRDGREAAGRNVRAALLDRAESYSSDARKFADMPKLGQTSDVLTEDDCKRYAVMYRTIADELRKVAASL